MKYSFYLSILFTLGFVLTSAETFACGKKSIAVENSCCKDKPEANKKSCCEKGAMNNHSGNHSCDGSCKDLSCQNSNASFGMFVPSFSLIHFRDFNVEKVKFFDAASQIAAGFHSLSLRPKIG